MTQEQAYAILRTGANIFLTGEPGAGKTYILNQYLRWLRAQKVPTAVTASTGIAATHVNGITIHSWSGIGARDVLSPHDLDMIASNEKTVRRIRKAKVLVIDEISMLDGRTLDMVESVCRTVFQNGEPFGGLQVVLVGDFFQLPPVAGRGDMPRFAFESRAWDSARFITCYIKEQHRQEDDMLLSLLSSIRKNDIDESHYTLLGEQTDIGIEGIEPTKLFTHNRDVDAINQAHLESLPTKRAIFKMEARGGKQHVESLVRNCLSPEVLELRIDAMVMCTKNNFEAGYVNGTLGRVINFDATDGFPIIKISDGREIKMHPQTWSVQEDTKVLAEIEQLPLRLAWAITIHKSQGMSLDAAEIDLRNAFTYGQGYVALSRVRTLAGMKVIGLNGHALLVDPRVIHKDEFFSRSSDDAIAAFAEIHESELEKMYQNFVAKMGGTWTKSADVSRKESPQSFVRENTYAQTMLLIEKNLDVAHIAKERKMAHSTIWAHVEKLYTDGAITTHRVEALIPSRLDWPTVYPQITNAFEKHGTERLKPIYEEMKEVYDYDIIRIARMLYTSRTP